MAEEKTKEEKTKRDMWLERMKSHYPDVENEDDYYGNAMDEYDARSKADDERKGHEKSLVDLIAERPQFGSLIANLKDMNDPEASSQLISMYGEDLKNSLDNEESIKAMAAAQSERMKREAENKAFTEQCEKDFESRLDMIGKFCQDKGMNDEDAAKFMGLYLDFCNRGATSKFSEDDLIAFYKGTNYDTDIQEAENKGKVEAKNEKIEMKKKEMGSEVPTVQSERVGIKPKKQVARQPLDNFSLGSYKPGKRF